MEEITRKLKILGLGDHEALVYSTLLQSSPSGAANIARKCSLSRSSVYTTLNSLIGKGLVGTTYKNDVKQFTAEDSSSLEELLNGEKDALRTKFAALANIRSDLQQLQRFGLNIPHIIFFEGQEGLKKIYLSMMRQASTGTNLYLLRDEFVWDPAWQFIFEDDWRNRIKRLKIEKRIKTKLLVNGSALELAKRKYYQTRPGTITRFLPPMHAVEHFAIYIISDIVSILSIENGNMIGIKITNQHLANNFKSVFKNLWNSSKG